VTAFEKELATEFERVVTDQLDSLYRTALRLLGNAEDAEDAVQECCARAYRGLDGFKPGSTLKPWLFRILKNICIDRLRWRARVRHVSIDDEDCKLDVETRSSGDTPEGDCIRSSLGRMIDKALAELTVEQRTVVVLVLIEGFTYAEAAEALDVAEGTIRSRLNRARSRLREALSSRDDVAELWVSSSRPRLVM